MNLTITIDTEEDNWSKYSTTNNPVGNIERLVPLQKIFDRYGVRPTYLVTYPVATNPRSLDILKRILEEGGCEIGIHCHPWNTPPFDEHSVIRNQDTMLSNLPENVVIEKLRTLFETICQNFEVKPVSFRAGRWALGPGVAPALCQLGVRVDTSVTPYTSWIQYSGPSFSDFTPKPFRFGAEGLHHKTDDGALLEVPATIGFLQKDFELCHRLVVALENPIGRKLHLKGLLGRLNLVNKLWLSPEYQNAASMLLLARRMEGNGFPCINLTFHSSSMVGGLTPFVKTVKDEKNFMENIRSFLEESNKYGWTPKTLSELDSIL